MITKRFQRALAVGTAAGLMATAFTITTSFTASPTDAAVHSTHSEHRSGDAIRFRNKMRKLWEDHIVWTRQFIVSSIADLPDAGTAASRLLRNQNHIGNAIKPFYGDAAGEQLTSLLRDHILIAADLLTAAKEGDSAAVEEASERWDDNGRDIADFLAAANPRHWARAEMRSMMAEHLEWTLAEATARLSEDWDADVAAYERIHRDILHMADMLSRGIIAQFPKKF